MQPAADCGGNILDNAIVLCLRCHGEVGHEYNSHHPIGNKYTISEIRKFRDDWWIWCEQHPFAPIPTHPIQVSPNETKLIRGTYHAKSCIKVTNTSIAVLYDIWVVIFFEKLAGITTDQLAITMPNIYPEFNLEGLEYSVGADILIFRAQDQSNINMLLINIRSIDPSSTLTMFLETIKTISRRQEDLAIAKIFVEHFATEPLGEPLTFQGSASIPFMVPSGALGDLKILGMDVKLARQP
jgi:hypothetical protein